MLAAGEISLALGLWRPEDQQRQRAVIAAAGLPLAWPALDPQAVLACLQGDKKVRSGRVRFVLPSAIGAVEIRDDVEPEIIVLALERLKSPQSGA
jgi:3-dehydroquinate synthase